MNEVPQVASTEDALFPSEFSYGWTCRVVAASAVKVTAVVTPDGGTPGGEVVADFQQELFPTSLGWQEHFRITTARPGLAPARGSREELFYTTVSETTDEQGIQRTMAVQKIPPLSPEEHAAALRRAKELHTRIQKLVG
jgi:hypothetical protein